MTTIGLSDLLATLRKNAGLSRRQLERVSGVSEETIKGIEYGNNTHPTPDTLRKVAVGLATNRALARVDQGAADEMLTSLMRAAGYVPTPGPDDLDPAPAVDMRAVLMSKGFRPHETAVVDRILDDLAGRDADQREQIVHAVATMLALRDEQERPNR